MQIESIHIQNFRGFESHTVMLKDYNCFVGMNGAGKSTILAAINAFFEEKSPSGRDFNEITIDDVFAQDVNKEVHIAITFSNLSPEAQEQFKHYFRSGKLVIAASAKLNSNTDRQKLHHSGIRYVNQHFSKYFEMDKNKAKASDLKDEYYSLREKFPELPSVNSKTAYETALREHEEAHPEHCEPIESADQLYGNQRVQNIFKPFLQWIYVPALKDASTESLEAKNSALGKLIGRLIRSKTNFEQSIQMLHEETRARYATIIGDQQRTLDELSEQIRVRLSTWATPGLDARVQWVEDPVKGSIKIDEPIASLVASDDKFSGSIENLGHGVQRSYILAILQSLAEIEASSGSTLVLGIEEPELYQHPPQARHLCTVLRRLANDSAQVLVTTHSPLFIEGRDFGSVAIVRRGDRTSGARVISASPTEIAEMVGTALNEQPVAIGTATASLHQALQPSLNEMFFCERLVLVEGVEDKAILEAWFHLNEKWDDFRRRGLHIVECGGKSNILRPACIAAKYEIPLFIVFDADSSHISTSKESQTRRWNSALLRFIGKSDVDPFPTENIIDRNCAVLSESIQGAIVAELGAKKWDKYLSEACRSMSYSGKAGKNTLMLAEALYHVIAGGDNIKTLDDLCDRLIAF